MQKRTRSNHSLEVNQLKNELFKGAAGNDPARDESATFIAAVRKPRSSGNGTTIRAAFLNPTGIHVKKAGYNIYGPKGDLLKSHTEACSHPESKFSVSYHIKSQPDDPVNRNPDCQYEFFIIHNDVTYVTDRLSFLGN